MGKEREGGWEERGGAGMEGGGWAGYEWKRGEGLMGRGPGGIWRGEGLSV
jgi:hypothetical protein